MQLLMLTSGDVAPHTGWDETLTSQFQCTETLAQMMRTTLRNKRVLPTIGNHGKKTKGAFAELKQPYELVKSAH
jgi:hypothetical protein